MIHRFSQIHDQANAMAAGQRYTSNRSEVEQKHSLLQIHDPESNDMAFANAQAKEMVNLSGANVIVYARTNNGDHDEVWGEDANPTYLAGKHLKGYFVPQPLNIQLTQWGADGSMQTTVIFCREDVYKEFGKRMLRIGDIIELPYNGAVIKPDRFRILNAFDSGNFRYAWLYFSCLCENITGDEIIDIDHK